MTEVVDSRRRAAQRLDRSVVAIGNFDGMHRGHQAIFEETLRQAADHSAPPTALTFEPHPQAFFRPGDSPSRLSPPPYKFELMGDHGIEVVVALTFDESIAGLTPEQFAQEILAHDLKAQHVVVGRNFRFGKKRAGDTDSLRELGAQVGMSCSVVDFVEWQQEPVSSTRIRRAVEAGRMQDAEEMLGRAYRLHGEVVRGDQRGRQIGVPTANIDVIDMAMPPRGVYATTLARPGGQRWRSVTNIGTRPTFEGTELTVESFVIDGRAGENLDLYGDEVELDAYRRIRGEREFDSAHELVAQIECDVDDAGDFFDREDFDGG